MYAVIKTGGKQYRVARDDFITVEKLPAEVGDTVQLDHVLMVGGDKPQLGKPRLEGASVSAEVVEQTRSRKIIVFKKKRRKNYRRKKGHRQDLTVLKITGINAAGGAGKAAPKKAAKTEETADKAPAEASESAKES
ncbi:MAG: 50S ribosomal protein L21 [Alphaproteobacteria bacterium]